LSFDHGVSDLLYVGTWERS
jgi:hypothetical protein